MVSLPDLILPKVRYFGIAIDRTVIRATELDNANRVRSLAEVRFPEDLFASGILVKPSVFVTALKNLYTAGKFTTQFVTVCFPEAYAYTKETALPKVPLVEVQEAIGWQAKNFFPFPKEDIYYDWRILRESESEFQLAVVAVQKTVLDPLVNAILESGLKPLRFEPDASAIARLVSLKQGQYVLVTDLNPRGAYVTLVEGEKAVFTTVVNLSQNDTQESYVANMCQAISDVATYYKQKNVMKDGISVILTGELATEKLASEMAARLQYQIKILNTQIQNPAFNKAYAAATARVVHPMDERSINLIPTSLQLEYDQERRSLLYARMLTRFLLITGFLTFVIIVLFVFAKIEENQLGDAQRKLENELKLEGSSQQSLLLLNAQASTIVNLSPLRQSPRQKINSLASIIGDSLRITQWEYDDAKLEFTISGTADTRDELLAFKSRLESSQDFAKVTIPLASLENSENVKFSISFVTK